MRFAKQILTVILFTFYLASCQQEKEIVMENELVLYPKDVNAYIAKSFTQNLTVVCEDAVKHRDTLAGFYAERNNEPMWWKALSGDSAAWVDIQNYFSIAEQHGMDRRYYYLPVINYLRTQIGEHSTEDSAYTLMAELDILLTNAFVESYLDIAKGRTNPKDLYGHSYMLPFNKDRDMDWVKFVGSRKKEKRIAELHKNDTTYNQLLELLAKEQEQLRTADQRTIDFSAFPKISPGDTADVLIDVIRRLKKNFEPDSSILGIEETNIYNRALVPVIQALQEKNNLAADGVLGFKTYKLINATSYTRIKQIKTNLERSRWFQRPDPEKAPFIYVNLPEYVVTLHYADSTKQMKVCIGKNLPDNFDEMMVTYTDSGWLHKLPKDMETPQIAARVSQVVINPTWTVPKSIIKNEMYWQMRKDPEYLERNHYVVYKGDSLLDSRSIDWSRFKPNTVPYRIVQVPGDHNALGKVKYIFWNAFDIFMHDTPQKKKFELPQRAVSHGCVRLEQPLLFGEFAMEGSRKFNADDFRIMMGYEPLDEKRLEEWDPEDSTAAIQPIDTTFKIKLERPIPLYMDYRTISFDSLWQPKFNYDIYDRNKYIWRAMEAI